MLKKLGPGHRPLRTRLDARTRISPTRKRPTTSRRSGGGSGPAVGPIVIGTTPGTARYRPMDPRTATEAFLALLNGQNGRSVTSGIVPIGRLSD